jgi:rRNA-processing protein FCF1
MKPKTFRYNEIITFFEEARTPLSDKQKAVIAERVRNEFKQLEEHREVERKWAEKRLIKKLKRRQERGSNQTGQR